MKPTYTEIYICDPSHEESQNASFSPDSDPTFSILSTGISKNYFMRLIENVSKKSCPYKVFKRSFKTYCFQDLFMENKDEKDIEVYRKEMLMFAQDPENDLIHIAFHKKKEMFNVFPSTTNLNAIHFTNRMSFLVNSHIYINFDVCYYMENISGQVQINPNECFYKVFVNLNTEKNIDIENSKILIHNAIQFVRNKV